MSGHPFTFPPPPPPPPRRATPGQESSVSRAFPPQDRVRGRGGHWRGQRGARGHGASTNPNREANSYTRGNAYSSRYAQPRNPDGFPPPVRNGSHAIPGTSNGLAPSNKSFKRDHETAFNTKAFAQNRPKAAPAIPSFNADIGSLVGEMTSRNQASSLLAPTGQNRSNLLGLNPALDEAEASGDNEDEEVNATIQGTSLGYEFEFRGQTSALRSPAEIAAWLAERRMRYPTAAKAEAAKKEAEERRRILDAARREQQEAGRHRRPQLQRAGDEQASRNSANPPQLKLTRHENRSIAPDGSTSRSSAARKTEKLREKAEKAARALARAEKALQEARDETNSHIVGNSDTAAARHPSEVVKTGSNRSPLTGPAPSGIRDDNHSTEEDILQTTNTLLGEKPRPVAGSDSSSDVHTGSETTSSSGSDSPGLDSIDSGPEQMTTNQQVPLRVKPLKRDMSNQLRPPDVCRYFWQGGRCKYGEKCRYKHERRPQRVKSGSSKPVPRRKRLWEVLVEKEKEQQREQMLRVIVTLGKQGVLDGEAVNPATSVRNG